MSPLAEVGEDNLKCNADEALSYVFSLKKHQRLGIK
jgi:hypothetical protein